MSRTDRSPTALRPLAITQSVLSRADGSAQFSFGNVSVLASVTGPVEVRLREELVDRATFELNLVPLTNHNGVGPSIKADQAHVRSLFERVISLSKYPRSLVQVTAQTVSNPTTDFSTPFSFSSSSPTLDHKGKGKAQVRAATASEQAARINSISLALVDAGIQLGGVLIAVAIAFLPPPAASSEEEQQDEMVLDPTAFEEERATSRHVVTVSFGLGVGGSEGDIVGVESVGQFTSDQLFDAHDLALNATRTILGFVRKSVEIKYGVDSSATATTATAPDSTTGLPTTTKKTTTREGRQGKAGNEVKMCVAEEGSDMSDPDDDDQVMI